MRDGREERKSERGDRKKRMIKKDAERWSTERERQRIEWREKDEEKQSSSYTARRGQQDWKRPMLDRDQLLSPTCLVDSRIIA